MTIAIPAILDTQIAALRADLEPNLDGATGIAASSRPPVVEAARIADLIDELMGLIDSGTLTCEGVHKVADATNPATSADATDLTSAQTLLNELKTDANAHFVIVGANEHVGADVTNSITSVDATNQATAETLANELKADINAHRLLAAATGHYVADPANAITAADASDLTTLLTLTNEIKTQYNAHIASINAASTTTVNDRTAFTTAGSLAGCTITFAAATTTVALQGVSATVASHTTSVLTLQSALPASPVEGDTFTLAFSVVDTEIGVLRDGKGLSDSPSNPYGSGPALANAALKIFELLGPTRDTLQTASTDAAGATTTLVDSGETWDTNEWQNLWAYADASGALDVDNLRRIASNNGTTITARNAFTVVAGTPTAPGSGTVYAVRDKQIYTATAAAGAAATLTFPATIDFALNELVGIQIAIVSGTGAGQRRNILSNTAGVSSVVTVNAWDVTPDATSVFELRDNTMPAFLVETGPAEAEPFGLLSPHGGGSGVHGHASATMMGIILQTIRDLVASYTIPA